MTTLTNDQIAAIAASLKGDTATTAKQSLEQGKHDVDFTVRIQGTLSKGADKEATPTVKTPWLTVLALLVHRAGFQRDKAMELIREAMTEAMLTDNDEAKIAILMAETGVADAKKTFEAEVLAKLPKMKQSGAVKGDLTITVVA